MVTSALQSTDAEIGDVLKRNIEVAEQIKTAANELEVVHAVLSTKTPALAAEGDLQAAVERTGEIEQQLTETAEALDRSNDLLREMGSNRAPSTTAET